MDPSRSNSTTDNDDDFKALAETNVPRREPLVTEAPNLSLDDGSTSSPLVRRLSMRSRALRSQALDSGGGGPPSMFESFRPGMDFGDKSVRPSPEYVGSPIGALRTPGNLGSGLEFSTRGRPQIDAARDSPAAASPVRPGNSLSDSNMGNFTFLKTEALQGSISSLIKAVVMLSEENKTMKEEHKQQMRRFDSFYQMVDKSVASMQAQISENCLAKDVYAAYRYDDQMKVNHIAKRITEVEEANAKTSDLVLARVKAIESTTADAKATADWAKANCAPQDEVQRQLLDVNSTMTKLTTTIQGHEEKMQRDFKELSAFVERVAGDVVDKTHLACEKVEQIDHAQGNHQNMFSEFVKMNASDSLKRDERSNTLQREVKQLEERLESRLSSMTRTVGSEIDSKVDAMLSNVQHNFSRYDNQIGSLTAFVDSKIFNVEEKLADHSTDLSTLKTEVSSINSILSSIEGSALENAQALQERMAALDATTGLIEKKQGHIRERLAAVDKTVEGKAVEMVEDLQQRITGMKLDIENSCKSFFVARFTEYQATTLEAVSEKMKEEAARAADTRGTLTEEKLADVSKTIAEALNNVTTQLQEKVKRASKSSQFLYDLLGINTGVIPSNDDTKEQRDSWNRYIRSLPWFPRVVQTPVIGDTMPSMQLDSPTDEAPTVSEAQPAVIEAQPASAETTAAQPPATQHGQLSLGLTAAEIRPIDGAEASDSPSGVVVTALDDRGPGHAAGLGVGDLIVAVGSQRVTCIDDFANAMSKDFGLRVAVQFLKWIPGEQRLSEVKRSVEIIPVYM